MGLDGVCSVSGGAEKEAPRTLQRLSPGRVTVYTPRETPGQGQLESCPSGSGVTHSATATGLDTLPGEALSPRVIEHCPECNCPATEANEQ